MQDLEYWIWLSRLNLPPISLKKCLKKYPIKDIWDLNHHVKEFFTKAEINRINNKNYKKQLQAHANFLNTNGIKVLTIKDKNYPTNLINIEDSPIVLYTFGNTKLLQKKNIAIVGSRNCTEYGKTIAKAFAYLLSKNNIVITSGLAVGIDKYAHQGTLMANGNTIAVIGTGMDIIYPRENKDLFNSVINNNGLIISEYPLGTKPQKANFPKRNRIISGIADGVLVVEAKEKSGALITVDYALDQGKNIYAIPRKYIKSNIKGNKSINKGWRKSSN